MINNENLNKIYEGIISGKELTTKELNSYGFNSKDLADLINNKKLERVKRGYYKFIATDDLYYYGKKLIAAKEHDKSDICFEKCSELDPNHQSTNFQLFLRSIKNKNYDQAFNYFEVIFDTENPYYKADYNFYLYLLNNITTIPEKYREYTKHLKFQDIRVDFDDKRYKDIPLQNKMRSTALQQKFPFALQQLNGLTIQAGVNTVQDVLIRILLIQAIDAVALSEETLINLIKSKQYNEIIEYLEKQKRNHNLSTINTYVLLLAKDILEIQKKKKFPEIKKHKTDKLLEAIDGYNYTLALKIYEEYKKEKNIEKETPIYLLLKEVNNLQNKITESKETKFSDIVTYLMNQDIDNALISLKEYMKLINKSNYEYLIINLIKISLLEKDNAFIKPMTTLSYLSRDNFNFDISIYIQEFYISLSQNKLEVAKIYLDIISNANKLNQDNTLTEKLLQVLTEAETILNNKKQETKTNETIAQKEVVKNSNNIPKQIYSYQQPNIKVQYGTKDNEETFIESKYNVLKEQGIILLKPMNSERREKIHNIVKEYPDMTSFEIGKFENTQIVLRYVPYNQKYIDIKQLLHEAKVLHFTHNYDGAIKKYLKALQIGTPTAYVYGMLGLSYMKKGHKEKAVEYLTIATYLGTQEEKSFKCDYTELIDILNGKMTKEERKPRFSMNEKDFNNDTTNYFDIDNFEEINAYIIESGLDVESACKELNMSDEQITKIKLLYTREYYSQGEYEKGDEFLNSVEKEKNKSNFTKKQLLEIRKNKKFYFNREKENPKKLSLTLKPRGKK